MDGVELEGKEVKRNLPPADTSWTTGNMVKAMNKINSEMPKASVAKKMLSHYKQGFFS